MKRVWKRDTHQYASGESLFVGRIKVGWAGYDGNRSRNDTKKYKARIDLPSIKLADETVYHETAEDAKARVERALDTWIKWFEEE